MDIKLSATNLRNLGRVMKYVGIDCIPTTDLDEATDVSNMTADELLAASDGKILPVPTEVIKSIPIIIEKFKESGAWYEEINKAIYSITTESMGSLYLGLLATTSAQEHFDKNIKNSIKLFTAVKDDIDNNPKLLYKLIDLIRNKFSNSLFSLSKYVESTNDPVQNTAMYKFIKKVQPRPNKMYGATRIIKYYMDNGNSITKSGLVKIIQAALNPKTGKINPKNKFIGSYKILNFALNLLDPNYTPDDLSIVPATIDTHMILFFYPFITEYSAVDRKKFKTDVFSNTARKYTYIQRSINELAKGVNMTPNQLQAILWIASIQQQGISIEGKDLPSVINGVVADLNADHATLKATLDFAKKLKSVIA